MKTLSLILGGLFAGLLLVAVGGFLALRAVLAPLPGEWSVPLMLGPLSIQAGVPSLVRLATSAWGGPLLQGRRFATRHGQLELAWANDSGLQIRCAPCLLQPPGLGDEPLRLPEVRLNARRLGEQLWGRFSAGRLKGEWNGKLGADGIRLHLRVPSTPLADAYALFAAEIPEVGRARIEGSFSMEADLSVPDGRLVLRPRLEGFAVSGLGTESFVGARSTCGALVSKKFTSDSWLPRAVLAAEDQRFHEHPGYDLVELGASLARNQQAGRVARGGSTITQQVAKLLVTGGERSPVRKLRELLYAVEMERTLGKARILRLYLDHAPWGEGVCGAESAAQHYFRVHAHELTPAQASWLAAMLHNPQMEAQRWAATGQINLARAQWVALGMRGMRSTRKVALAAEMGEVDWKPGWVRLPDE